jgi:hypothetical protein
MRCWSCASSAQSAVGPGETPFVKRIDAVANDIGHGSSACKQCAETQGSDVLQHYLWLTGTVSSEATETHKKAAGDNTHRFRVSRRNLVAASMAISGGALIGLAFAQDDRFPTGRFGSSFPFA